MIIDTPLEYFTQKLNATFFLSEEGEPIFTINKLENGLSTYKAMSGEARMVILKHLTDSKLKRSKDAILQLQEEIVATAQTSGKREKTYLRIACLGSKIIIDRANQRGEIVEITPENIITKQNYAIPFLRPGSLQPLVGHEFEDHWLDLFESITNLQNKNEMILMLSFIIKCHIDGANPILILEGPQGSAKSSTSKILRSIIDPAIPPLVSPPKSPEDVLIESKRGHVLVFDNLSGIAPEMADVYCRVSTGGGITKRELYKDESFKCHNLSRPIIINGIEEPSDRADFAERSIVLTLSKIGPDKRISETQLEKKLEEALPKILGGVYQLISDVLRILPSIQHTNLPRMTEYARVGIAVEEALKYNAGFFIDTYRRNLRHRIENTFYQDPICLALQKLLINEGPEIHYSGTEELRTKVLNQISQDYKYSPYCPKTPSAFSGRLSRLGPILSEMNIEFVKHQRLSDSRPVTLRFIESDKYTQMKKPTHIDFSIEDIPF